MQTWRGAVLRGMRLMGSGVTASGERVSAADLANAVEAARCPAVGNPVVTVTADMLNPQWRSHDAEPAFGRVINLRMTGDGSLTGDLAAMPTWLRDEIAAGAHFQTNGTYRFTCQTGHRHPFVVSSVRVTVPGVKPISNLDDLRRAFAASSGGDVGSDDDELELREIRAAVREGRITAEGARRMLEVRAHSNEQARQQAHQAIDAHYDGGDDEPDDDEFSGLFPPGYSGGQHIVLPRSGRIYPGEQQGQRNRTSVSWDGYTSASAGGDDDDDTLSAEEWVALYPPASRSEANERAWANEIRAAQYRADADADEVETFRALYGRNPEPGELDD